MYYYNIISFFLILNYGNIIYAQDSCASRTTCQDCILDPSLCVWCSMKNFTDTRCRAKNSYENDWCLNEIQDPEFPIKELESNNTVTVQIKPQKYKLKLRPGQSKNFTFSFKPEPDYPVDLYFLFDASVTMKMIRNAITAQTENIYNAMRNITKDVYLGLGTFVDKRALPYVNFKDIDNDNVYSFRHRLSLNNNFTRFKELMSTYIEGRNRDPQEGGLDALAQVMACKELIGWRNESRKIIIFLTDGPYHVAGDGKLAGIFQPYDGKCYTDSESYMYTKELEMDYPSVGMINKLAVDNGMTILFYVKSDVYGPLSKEITGAKIFLYTEYNNNEIANTLHDIYNSISKKIKINIKSKHKSLIDISIKPDCISEDSGSDCHVEIDKEKPFQGTLKLLDYNEQDNLNVDLVVQSTVEKLTLDIDVIKKCECEADSNVEQNSVACSGQNRTCGICDCGDNRYGKTCACVKSINNNAFENSTCIAKGSDNICSGHGTCVCGGCVCTDGFNGTFCECSRNNCPRYKDALCSGVNGGECRCGQCVCKRGRTGKACECTDHNCKEDGRICSNRGKCGCTGCECNKIESWDARDQYNKKNCRMISSPERHNSQCEKLRSCSFCLRNEGSKCKSCHEKIKTSVVENLSEEHQTKWSMCYMQAATAGCYVTVVYRYDDVNYNIELVMKKDEHCAEKYYIFGGTFLMAIILIGIITLVVWKLLTDARDRREYKNFVDKAKESDRKSCNPIYQDPLTTFNNPGFRKMSYRSH